MSNWQENSDRLKSDAAKLRKIKTQAKLPNGGTYTICHPGTAPGKSQAIQRLSRMSPKEILDVLDEFYRTMKPGYTPR